MLAVAPGLLNGHIHGIEGARKQTCTHTRTATTQQRLPRRRFKRKRATWSTSIHKMHTCHNVGPCESNAAATATSTTPTTTTSEDFCGGWGDIHILSYTRRASVRAYRTHVELRRFAYTEHVKDARARGQRCPKTFMEYILHTCFKPCPHCHRNMAVLECDVVATQELNATRRFLPNLQIRVVVVVVVTMRFLQAHSHVYVRGLWYSRTRDM